jgi:hypothetical protein
MPLLSTENRVVHQSTTRLSTMTPPTSPKSVSTGIPNTTGHLVQIDTPAMRVGTIVAACSATRSANMAGLLRRFRGVPVMATARG